MKILTILALAIKMVANAQTYVSGSFSYYNGTGTFGEKGMATAEVGRTIHDVLSLGVAVGRTSFTNGRTYVEFRPTLAVWSKNNFTLSGTLGVGHIFDFPQSFLTEYCATLSYSFSPNLGISMFGGGYKFDGKNVADNYTFVGTGITYIFSKSK